MKEFYKSIVNALLQGAVVLCVLGGGTYYYMHEGSKQTQNLYTTGG